MLKYDFPCFTVNPDTLSACNEADGDAAVAGLDRSPHGKALLIAELRRTRADFAAAAPGRIARGQLSGEEADRIGAALESMALDMETELDWLAASRNGRAAAPRMPLPRPGDAVGWEEKVHVLRRELHFRRRYDPDRVAKGRLSHDAARVQLERLEAVHAKYWQELFAYPWPDDIQAVRQICRDHLRRREEAEAATTALEAAL